MLFLLMFVGFKLFVYWLWAWINGDPSGAPKLILDGDYDNCVTLGNSSSLADGMW